MMKLEPQSWRRVPASVRRVSRLRWAQTKIGYPALLALTLTAASCAKTPSETSRVAENAPESNDDPVPEQEVAMPVAWPIEELTDAVWTTRNAVLAKGPADALTITNDVSQTSILAIVDEVNARHGFDRFIDGYCGFGARLGRDYFGKTEVGRVSFQWDQQPKKTVISIYGTDSTTATVWKQEMNKALVNGLKEEAGKPKIKTDSANGNQPSRSEVNQTSSATDPHR